MTSSSILITGCSSGIGLYTAKALQQRGYQVFASARKLEDVSKLKALGLNSIQLDVNDPASHQQALDTILKQTGGTLDALFNNAGFLLAGAIEDLKPDQIRAQFETNVFGPIALSRAVLPIMRQQGHGRIIQNSSILGLVTLPFYGAYNASKFALEGFSRTLRQELRGTSIHVSLINPGPIESALRKNAFQHYQATLQQQNTLHTNTYKKLEANYFDPSKSDKKIMQSPEAVIKKLILALESKKPRLHYVVGLPAQSLAILQRMLPESLFEWLLTKISR